jgi:phosphatidylglycerophosphatase C
MTLVMPTMQILTIPNESNLNTVVYDMDGTLIRGDCGKAFIIQSIKASVWRLILALFVAPIALPLMQFGATRKMGVSACSWVASVGLSDAAYASALENFIAGYPIRPIEFTLKQCQQDIRDGREVVIATGANLEMTRAFMQALGLLENVHLVTSTSKRFMGGVISKLQCNGKTKLQELIKQGFHPPYLRVYSDSAMDLPILLATKQPILLNASAKDREKCRQHCPNLHEPEIATTRTLP